MFAVRKSKRMMVFILFLLLIPYRLFAGLDVTFIDVGQGDSILIKCDGESALIDTGVKNKSSHVIYVLRKNGIENLDLIVMTHDDQDHVGGIESITSSIPLAADGMVLSSFNYGEAFWGNGAAYVIPSAGDIYVLGGAVIKILSPEKELRRMYDSNDRSLVFLLEYKGKKLLFTGDASDSIERELVDRYGNELKNIDVLKVGHHGAYRSSSYYFLRTIQPDYSVISVGQWNKYGHPSESTLSRLVQSGSKVYRTDLHGDIVCRISDSGMIHFYQQKGNGPMDPAPYLSSSQKSADEESSK